MPQFTKISELDNSIQFATDNVYSIGAAASGRPSTGYFATSVFSPLIVGGTATTADLSFKTTSGVGATGADMHFLVGNNGATEAMTILNSGFVGIGTAGPAVSLHVLSTTADIGGDRNTGDMVVSNSSAIAAGVGGQINFSGKYTSGGGYNDAAAFIKTYKVNADDGDYSFGLKLGVRNNGVGLMATAVTINNLGNVGIGTTTPGGSTGGTVGTTALSLGNGTAPVGGVANQVSLYSADVTASAELFALDEAGNAPQLSPHPGDFLNTLPLEGREYPWAYRASNCYLGKQIDVDMMGAIRAIEQLSNKQFIYLSDLAQDKRADWDAGQDSQYKEREKRIADLQAQIADLERQIANELDEKKRAELRKSRDVIQIPEPYQKKAVPQWMRARGVKSKI